MQSDFIFILQWWGALFILGLIFFPLTKLLFKNSPDSFYIFSKIIGVALLSYILFLLGTLHILPFNIYSILFVLFLAIIANIFIVKKYFSETKKTVSKIIIFEELLFFIALCSWSFVRAHEPSIQTLEKFMDYGFINSILRSDFFPPKDMWLTPFSINYYFFGHLVTAVLIKLSFVPSFISYNLMVGTIFAFTFTGAFSLLFNFLQNLGRKKSILGGILGGILLSLSGNLQTIYSFFATYSGEKPVPLWALDFLPNSFPNGYWYPNATRFIPFTIHEFPLYSFIVSDLHGHVLDIPFVLLTIALAYTILQSGKITKLHGIFISLLLAIMYMTNVWDGIIYLGLVTFAVIILNLKLFHFSLHRKGKKNVFPYVKNVKNIKKFVFEMIYTLGLLVILYVLFSLPFNLHFKPFVSGIGIVCAPDFLAKFENFGPILFEKDHCQRSEPYQLLILYGFFIFFCFTFTAYITKGVKKVFTYYAKEKAYQFALPVDKTNIFMLLLIFLSLLLILLPEFVYAKDIYPAHYRANTMFKLVYQAFIMLTIASTYAIVFLLAKIKNKLLKIIFLISSFILLALVLIYPYFAIKSYYGDLREYKGLNGTEYIRTLNPDDLELVTFLNKNVSGQPVILEAQGDSYTNFARISANTGLPTVLGWTVHEWLWRGSYDIPAPRITEIQTMYEGNLEDALPLLKKYQVKYVVVGPEEKLKYKVVEDKFRALGKEVFSGKEGKTKLYQLSY